MANDVSGIKDGTSIDGMYDKPYLKRKEYVRIQHIFRFPVCIWLKLWLVENQELQCGKTKQQDFVVVQFSVQFCNNLDILFLQLCYSFNILK